MLQFDNYTLDFDSSIMTRYGMQQGTRKGYNPKKRGRNSHHPLLAFVADVRMVANFWLRPGNTSASNNFIGFLEDTLSKLKRKQVGLVRMDSGFYSQKLLAYLEEKSLNYVISVKNYPDFQRELMLRKSWFEYLPPSWPRPRRIVAVRQKIDERPHAVGKQLTLFEDDELIGQYC